MENRLKMNVFILLAFAIFVQGEDKPSNSHDIPLPISTNSNNTNHTSPIASTTSTIVASTTQESTPSVSILKIIGIKNRIIFRVKMIWVKECIRM